MITPPLVQEPRPAMSGFGQEEFVFLTCQHGAEPSIKTHLLGAGKPYRLAFSRPGLLTFKLETAGAPIPRHWLIRQSGYALGTVKDEDAEALVQRSLALAGTDWECMHVFQRDLSLPGIRGFEPGPTELTEVVKGLFQSAISAQHPRSLNTSVSPLGSKVLDVVLIEPNQWLIGYHLAEERFQCWPGGSFPVAAPPEMISRAYLKMSEAVAWSGLPIESGDAIVEIGSAPGGACQRLLDLGLVVTGVDPAEMDPLIASHERFTHWRSKSAGLKRRQFAKFRWLAADANVAPNYTLDAVEDIVTYPSSAFEGLLLTFKLSSYELAEKMPEYLGRIGSWGFPRVEVRQLASNRRECCVVAGRGADWKRPSRALAVQQANRANADKRRARAAKKRAAAEAESPNS